jgi:hypothetical protein
MKNKSNLLNTSLFQLSSVNKLNQDGIPNKLLCEVSESARIYKHLATVAIMANLLILTIAIGLVR